MCRDHRLFALNIIVKKSRKVYFTDYYDMLDCLKQIHYQQGFQGEDKRLAQYEIMESLPNNVD